MKLATIVLVAFVTGCGGAAEPGFQNSPYAEAVCTAIIWYEADCRDVVAENTAPDTWVFEGCGGQWLAEYRPRCPDDQECDCTCFVTPLD